jgi:urease accessory protein
MRASLADVGRRGRLELIFAFQNGRTILRHAYCEVPFKITGVLNSGRPAAHLILMQCTAGLFGGDEVSCSIRIERGARVLLTQQAATKIHPSDNRAALQRNHVVVETGAELQLYLEPVIPFADSAIEQTTRIDLEQGARLVFWESFMSGRVGRGERWRFREFASETVLSVNNDLVYLDRFRLVGPDPQHARWAMNDCNYIGAGLFVGEQARCFAGELHQAIPEAGVDLLNNHVTLARIARRSGPDFHLSCEMFSRLAGTLMFQSLPIPTIL